MSGTLSAADREKQIPGAENRTPGTDNPRSRREAVLDAIDLYGPLAIALYFIATTRWGAFVIPGPPYIGDIALGVLIAERAFRLARTRRLDLGLSGPALALIVLSIGYALLTLATGPLNTDALRDFAPFGYLVLALLAPRTHAIPAARVASLLYWALVANLASVALARLTAADQWIGLDPGRDDPVFLFVERPDITGALLGVLVAVALLRVIDVRSVALNFHARGAALNLLVGGGAWALLVTSYSRAAFIAGALVIALAAAHKVIEYWRSGSRPAVAGLVSPIAVLILVPVVILSAGESLRPLDRATGAVRGVVESNGDSDSTETEPARGSPQQDRQEPGPAPTGTSRYEGYGTLNARYNGWRRLIEWMFEGGVDRPLIGVGFGPHYWQLSEADHRFQGAEPTETNRSAHNFVLHTWARLGVVGVVLLGFLVFYGLWRVWSVLFRAGEGTEPLLIASLLFMAILVVSSFGVVFETPFGALPFYWTLGYLLARPGRIDSNPASG